MTLVIGKRLRVEVASLQEASARYQQERDASGEGYHSFPDGRVSDHKISYNGRVWKDGVVVLEATSVPR